MNGRIVQDITFLADNLNDIVARFDTEGRFIYVNKSIETETGIPTSQFFGKTHSELNFNQKVIELWKKNLLEVLETGLHHSFEFKYDLPNNKSVYETRLAPEKDTAGKIESILAIIINKRNRKEDTVGVKELKSSTVSVDERDTLLKTLRESEERFRNIFEKSKVIMLLIDPEEGSIIDANMAAAEFYGYSHEQLCSMKIQDINQLSPDEVYKERAVALNESRNYFIFPHRLANNDIRWVEVCSSPVLISNKHLLFSIIHDISERKAAEDQLRKLSSAVEQSPNSIIITDASGNIEYANPEFTRITGYSVEEVIGKNPRIFKSGKTDPLVYKNLWETILSGNQWHGALQNKKKSGELYWESVNISPVFDTNGMITHFTAIKEDISERIKREDQLARLILTLRALRDVGDAIIHASDEQQFLNKACKIIVDDCGHPLVWIGFAENNEEKTIKAVADFGFDKGFFETQKMVWSDTEFGSGPSGTAIRTGNITYIKDMLSDPRFKPWRKEAVKRSFASAVALPLKNKGKTFGAISIYAKEPDSISNDEMNLLSELADDLAQGIAILRLKDAHATAEEELKKHRDHLEDLVLQRTDELSKANQILKDAQAEVELHKTHLEELVKQRTEELDAANSMLKLEMDKEKQVELLLEEALEKERELNALKSHFISTTSHEFRTPLTAILSSMQLIQRYRTKWSDDQIEEQFTKVKNAVFNLTNLLDDILTLSHEDSGRIIFNPKEIDLYQFCIEVLEEIKHLQLSTHKFNYEFTSANRNFVLDPKLVRFIMVNLVSNAFKYSPAGGRVKLIISSSPSNIEIIVQDEGIGIPPGDLENLFNPFFRAGNTGEIEGTGLGLSIVKRSVELHNGTIKCDSRPNFGTKFAVILPWKK